MEIDINYYFTMLLDKKQQEIYKKYFSKYNFKNLYSAIYFFKNIKEEDVKWIKNKKDKDFIIKNSHDVSENLKKGLPDLMQLYEEEILPNVDIQNLLYDLEPKINVNNTVLRCPSCGKKEAFIGNHGKGKVIVCNRKNKCGENTSILSYIRKREGLNFYQALKYIANNAGIDLEKLILSKQVMRVNGKSREKIDFFKRKEAIEKKIVSYKFPEINFKKLNENKSFKKIDTSALLYKVNEMNDPQKYQMALSYIRDFAMENRDKVKISRYFKKRGISNTDIINDVGFLPKEKIPIMVNELKRIFTEEKLIEFGILNSKGYWKYNAISKDDEKFLKCDAMLFSMHSPYTDIPTNLELRFLPPNNIEIKNKTVSIENSSLISPNYYGDTYTVDNLSKKDTWWFCEGIIDAKTISALGYNAVALTGVHKHYPELLGYFKNKNIVIAFDQDKAGIDNVQKFAETLYNAGVRNIFTANWDEKYGKDCNDLLINDNLDKICFSTMERRMVSNGIYEKPAFLYSINKIDINSDFIKKKVDELKNNKFSYNKNKQRIKIDYSAKDISLF